MWIAAFLGMATIFGEAIMAQKYKHVGKDGHVTGGPVYYIQAAFKGTFGKILATVFFCSDHFCTGIYGKCGTVQLDSVSISYCIWYTTDSGGDHYSGYRIVCICRRNFQNCKSYRNDCSNHGMFLYYRITDCNLLQTLKEIPYAFYSIVVGAFKPSAVSGGAVGATVKLALTKRCGKRTVLE